MRINLFWKTFISFMLVILLTNFITQTVQKNIFENNSSKIIDHNIEKIMNFKSELSALIYSEQINEAISLLLDNPKFIHQFFIFDEYDNEILERDIENTLAGDSINNFNSRFKQNIELEFQKRNIDLFSTINSSLGNQYYIVIHPVIHRKAFFSPTLAGNILRLILLIAISAVACYWLTRGITKRISKLQKATKQINQGNYKEHIPINKIRYFNKRDELSELTTDFNIMATKLQNNEISKRQTLSDISHELRSPLARIKVALAITEDQFPKTASQLHRIERETDRMNNLIEQIISIQKLQISQHIANAENIDLSQLQELIQTIIADVEYEYQNTGKTVKFTNLLQKSDDSEGYLIGDLDYLSSAIENVIRNAMSHTSDNSSVKIRIQINHNSNNTDKYKQIHIQITDNGPGVETDKIDSIFEPFSRLDSSRNRNTGGYGLGLSITKAVINNHNGEIMAFNNRNNTDNKRANEEKIQQGLTIIINLPLQPNI